MKNDIVGITFKTNFLQLMNDKNIGSQPVSTSFKDLKQLKRQMTIANMDANIVIVIVIFIVIILGVNASI